MEIKTETVDEFYDRLIRQKPDLKDHYENLRHTANCAKNLEHLINSQDSSIHAYVLIQHTPFKTESGEILLGLRDLETGEKVPVSEYKNYKQLALIVFSFNRKPITYY